MTLSGFPSGAGGVMSLAALEHVAAAARRHNAWVLSDEIYRSLAYDDRVVLSIATLPGMPALSRLKSMMR